MSSRAGSKPSTLGSPDLKGPAGSALAWAAVGLARWKANERTSATATALREMVVAQGSRITLFEYRDLVYVNRGMERAIGRGAPVGHDHDQRLRKVVIGFTLTVPLYHPRP